MRRLRFAGEVDLVRRRPRRVGRGEHADGDGGGAAEVGGVRLARGCRGGAGAAVDGVRVPFQEEGAGVGGWGECEEVEGDGGQEGAAPC